jgi:regulator of sigma E protease
LFTTSFSVILAALGFGFLVLVHELGHFFAAKWMGVRVEAFSIGFGPALKRKWGQTEYRLSIIPLGGYVKMAGEERKDDAASEPAPDEFYGKSVGQRSVVFAAGVFMNILFGFIFFIVAYGVGVPVVPAEVGGVVPGSPAWRAGLREGDEIVRVEHIHGNLDFEDVKTSIILADRGERISMRVKRDGFDRHVAIAPEYNEERGLMSGGILPPDRPVLAPRERADEARALYEAGLRGGDRITQVQVAGRPPVDVERPFDFVAAVESSRGKPVRITFERDGVVREPVEVEPKLPEDPSWLVGIRFSASAEVKQVREGSWADIAGIREADRIVAVEKAPVGSALEARELLDGAHDRVTNILIERGGKQRTLTVPAHRRENDTDWALAFGEIEPLVGAVTPGLPASEAGIAPGDRIVAVDGTSVTEAAAISRVLAGSGGRELRVTLRRNGGERTISLRPVRRWSLPVVWKAGREVMQTDALEAVGLGARKSFQWIIRVYATVKGLIRGSISPRHLSGPVTIFRVTYYASADSLGFLLYILAVISVNLGIVNLLPIPILDGGHLLFAALEKIRGKPLSVRLQAIASYVGLALLLSVFVVALWNDIRLIVVGF